MANMELSKYIKSESMELNRSAIHFEKKMAVEFLYN